MVDDPVCSSLFEFSNETAIYHVLEDIASVYDDFFADFFLFSGPVLVVVNLFAIFILTRKELRTPYNIVFLVMALDQGLAIFGRSLILWKKFLNLGCSFTFTVPWQIFEIAIVNVCPLLTAHVSWLAVIITSVRLRHLLNAKIVEPSTRYIITLCCVSFVLILAASVPLFLTFDLRWVEAYTICNRKDLVIVTVAVVEESERLYAHDCLLLRITYFSSGLLFNALPCLLLVFLSSALIWRLRNIQNGRAEIQRSGVASANSTRSSWMIALIVLTTLITDIPQAVINILVGFMSDRFRSSVAFRLSSIIITLVMIASLSNLTIHLCISKRFREVAKTYLCCGCRKVNSTSTTRVSSRSFRTL